MRSRLLIFTFILSTFLFSSCEKKPVVRFLNFKPEVNSYYEELAEHVMDKSLLLKNGNQIAMQGAYGATDYGGLMAMLVFAIIPIIIFYITSQKYIIKGVIAGAVKG